MWDLANRPKIHPISPLLFWTKNPFRVCVFSVVQIAVLPFFGKYTSSLLCMYLLLRKLWNNDNAPYILSLWTKFAHCARNNNKKLVYWRSPEPWLKDPNSFLSTYGPNFRKARYTRVSNCAKIFYIYQSGLSLPLGSSRKSTQRARQRVFIFKIWTVTPSTSSCSKKWTLINN